MYHIFRITAASPAFHTSGRYNQQNRGMPSQVNGRPAKSLADDVNDSE
jgi:hypothetical protein